MSEQPKSSTLEHYQRVAKHEVEFYSERVEKELDRLENRIQELRDDIERGHLYEYRSLVAKAAEVIEYVGKLRESMNQGRILAVLSEEVTA
jgi:hypothetical protein